MNNLHKLVFLLLIAFCWSCNHSNQTEKYQNKRDNVINVREKVKEIKIEDVLIGPVARLSILRDYLIVADYKSKDKLIHIFNKNNFNYITSTADRGQGPDEITNMGHIAPDEANRLFFVSDHGKQIILSYDLDSVLANPLYLPKVKAEMNKTQFPSHYQYVSDTLCFARIIKPIGNSDHKQSVAKWNMITGEIKAMKYEHPDIEKKRITFTASMEDNIYVECYSNYDLMTICNLNGDLKYNIYGPNWDSKKPTEIHYFDTVVFCKDKILVGYSGGDYRTDDYFQTMFLVFDMNGNYIKTLDAGYQICDFCYDKENNRIIMNLNDEIQFAYLDLDGLIE